MKKFYAFTMAEILLSLTIIGVIAAITLPSLTGNINERTWNTQRKALYARFSQAIALMPAINGYGTLKEESSSGAGDAVDTAAETFVTAGLAKVLKINNICDNAHLQDCGIINSYIDIKGSKQSMPTTLYTLNSWFSKTVFTYVGASSSFSAQNTKAIAFETQNGESIITYYHPTCKTELLNSESMSVFGETIGLPVTTMCANFIYDLNGLKGPNTVGKDIGIITVFNSIDSIVVAPNPLVSNAGGSATYSYFNAITVCKNQNKESRLPNIDELSAMMINKQLFRMNDDYYWSSSQSNISTRAWAFYFPGVRATNSKRSSNVYVRCIKR